MLDCEECNVKLIAEETKYYNGVRIVDGICPVCTKFVHRVETVIEK